MNIFKNIAYGIWARIYAPVVCFAAAIVFTVSFIFFGILAIISPKLAYNTIGAFMDLFQK